ncbi:hypothetical protein BPOR_0216g00040 [Botrytis porri]|uniref:Uncharacterized protein n=1 Tax=Botrytis porri TaxID=87229 RepID=A0A4Z1KS35_9HELO|nr:hypothetical protein BPOR_0216g00040 [Botrytis porri]
MAAKRRRAEKGKGKAVTIDLTADNSGDGQESESSERATKRRRVAKGKGKAVTIDLTAGSGGEGEDKDEEPSLVGGDEDGVDDQYDDLFVQDNGP